MVVLSITSSAAVATIRSASPAITVSTEPTIWLDGIRQASSRLGCDAASSGDSSGRNRPDRMP